ncbi:metal-dependent hydrolase [Simiduia sp. 21SJ11W-1]|uniref:metal-dependent hydrolase n=1 Tax=Simiduia sp. 21SJ11W-1 TaxID=2909669 RepID=UPI00209C7093|nr:metal-dependent hydrolase [Simiduia sp. 21SJ11W-1]UTA47859.1 metal-dependent hydrolase [Simiduia sp. 21SJ11W-1]
MDPVTQGVLGATLPQSTAKTRTLLGATVIGGLAGMAPDLDVLIRSSTDPLLFLEFHRQFTHSLLFIPIGGAVCGLLLHWLLGRRLQLSRLQSVAFATLGYATHALLDACTTYGTQLLWPLSDQRFAWNTVSIIDPLFTLPLLLLIIAGVIARKPRYARIGMVWALCYLSLGALQRERAEAQGQLLAESRGHMPIRLEAKPTFANLWLWKLVYETDTHFFVDAVRVTTQATLYEGDRVPKLDIKRDFPWLLEDSQQARDIARFYWFSNGYVAVDDAQRLVDVRYSMVPNEIKPLWGIALNPAAGPTAHVRYFVERETGPRARATFWAMLTGKHPPATQQNTQP